MTPSVVAFAKDGEVLVGQVAKRQAITNPENTIFFSERFSSRTHLIDATGSTCSRTTLGDSLEHAGRCASALRACRVAADLRSPPTRCA